MATVVLLPGLLCDKALWAGPAEALEEAGFDVLVPDLTAGTSIEEMASGVLAQAPAEFHLAGLSMGGYVALAVASLAPARLLRLALLNTNARADTPEQTASREALIQLAQAEGVGAAANRLIPLMLRPTQRRGPLAEAFSAMAARVGLEAFVRQQRAISTRPDRRPELSEIKAETLVIAGDLDRLMPTEVGQELADLIPRSELLLLPETAHLSSMERPTLVAQALRDWTVGLPSTTAMRSVPG